MLSRSVGLEKRATGNAGTAHQDAALYRETGNRYGAGTASACPSDRCGGSAQKICQRKVLDKRCASGQLALLTSAAPSMLLARVSLRTVKTSHSDDVDGSGRGDAESQGSETGGRLMRASPRSSHDSRG